MLGTLLGNYRVVGQLGQGGMGVVYLGRHETLGHRVVVKVLLPELSRHPDMVRRFFNEAQAATAIRNPGIVQVFDFGATPDGRAYFVMELLEGETLQTRLAQRRHDHAECCRLGRQIANVLQAAHAAGITHRDLKPENLFLVRDPEVIGGERVKVLDFGIAKLASDARVSGLKTHTGIVMGTADYMSPEQCRSASAADARSDIYSLGCILFQVACGRPPFVGLGFGDIVAGHLHEPPPPPQHLAPDIPLGLAALIAKMLAKRPDERPQTMTQVSHALDEIVRALGPSPLPARSAATPAPSPPAPPSGRHARPVRDPAPPHAPSPAPRAAAPPVQLPPAARLIVPQLSPASATLHGTPGIAIPPGSPVRRLPFVLGAVVVAGAVAAIAIVLAKDASEPSRDGISTAGVAAANRPSTPDSTAADSTAADSTAADSTATDSTAAAASRSPASRPVVDVEPASRPVVDVEPPASGRVVNPDPAPPPSPRPAPTAVDVEAACRNHERDRKWSELGQCAERLASLAPQRAEQLRIHAIEEIRSAPWIAAAQQALRDGDLKRARAALDQVWAESVDRASVKRSYDLAEAAAITALSTRLDGAKDGSCGAYNQLLARERAVAPPRVVTEAARRVPCTPAPRCDADALAEEGRRQFGANQLASALASYDAAYACRPAPGMLQKALVVACNLRDVALARSYWKRLPEALRLQAASVCVRNDITEQMLNGP